MSSFIDPTHRLISAALVIQNAVHNPDGWRIEYIFSPLGPRIVLAHQWHDTRIALSADRPILKSGWFQVEDVRITDCSVQLSTLYEADKLTMTLLRFNNVKPGSSFDLPPMWKLGMYEPLPRWHSSARFLNQPSRLALAKQIFFQLVQEFAGWLGSGVIDLVEISPHLLRPWQRPVPTKTGSRVSAVFPLAVNTLRCTTIQSRIAPFDAVTRVVTINRSIPRAA